MASHAVGTARPLIAVLLGLLGLVLVALARRTRLLQLVLAETVQLRRVLVMLVMQQVVLVVAVTSIVDHPLRRQLVDLHPALRSSPQHPMADQAEHQCNEDTADRVADG